MSTMVFLPMPAYGLFKRLLNIDSGYYTLIIATLWVFFFELKRIVSACLLFQIGRAVHFRFLAYNQDILLRHTKNGSHTCANSHFKIQSGFLGIIPNFPEIPHGRSDSNSFQWLLNTFKNQVVPSTIRHSGILGFHLELEDNDWWKFISCTLSS